jgi:catechol 2,3-dioxygenase-like lactoylglutathione lyase family enzyme
MAGKKDKKKAKKAAKKARKEAKRAEKRAAKLAKKAPKQATKQATKTAPKRVQKSVPKKVQKKAAKAARKASKAVAKPKGRVHQARQQPESLRLRSAGPSFTVDNIDKSVAFYRDVLGFTQKDKWEEEGALKGVELLAGSVTFWLDQDDWKKGRGRVKGEGFRISCDTMQDIDVLAARVRSTGTALAEEPKDQPWGGRYFAVRDPDGFLITISSGF